jgi:hypothetical protein
MDAKVTNQSMVARMETWARFGHSCGDPFIVDDHKKEHPEYAFSDLVDIIPQRWATFGAFAKVKVLVLDESGDSVSNANITFENCLDGTTYYGETDQSGSVYFPYMPQSLYNVTAKNGEKEVVKQVEISSDLNFELILKKPDSKGFKVDDFTIWGLVSVLVILICIYLVYKKVRKQ